MVIVKTGAVRTLKNVDTMEAIEWSTTRSTLIARQSIPPQLATASAKPGVVRTLKSVDTLVGTASIIHSIHQYTDTTTAH